MITLQSSISALGRVGKVTETYLKALGIETCEDLIFYFPRRFDDFSLQPPIKELKPSMLVTVSGRIDMLSNRRSKKRRMTITEALVSDETGSIKVIWFNQAFLINNLSVGDQVSLSGKMNDTYYDLQLVNPAYEKLKEDSSPTHIPHLVPVYSLPAGISQKQFRFLIHSALEECVEGVPESIPTDILEAESLPTIQRALQDIHAPESKESFERALQRFKFEELFFLNVCARNLRNEFAQTAGYQIVFHEHITKEMIASLGFSLTVEQKKVLWEIIKDMEHPAPMNRLLEGDVGSGKTIVAALSMAQVCANGYQCVLMAPTEILASQHYNTLRALFEGRNVHVALLTSQYAKVGEDRGTRDEDRKELISAIGNGSIDIIIGTHALIQEKIRFHTLALAVIDEQHRFGVKQRKTLREKNSASIMPHLLSLTATPIPRSLALTVYGDLDLSIIKKLPGGRKSIITKIVPHNYREWTYDFIKKEIKKGRQIFIMCPLIDVSDTLGAKSVKEEYSRLSKIVFKEFRLSMLHGRMRAQEKEQVMSDMLEKKIDILVTTTVVEVGVDIPNASMMLIEGAERFGLAQLHQLRGRVGRSTYQSYCFLLPTDEAKVELARLKAVVDTTDGFALAEKDLELRGQGDVFGARQSGLPQLKLASLTDIDLIQSTRHWAEKYARRIDEFPLLKKRIVAMQGTVHLE